MVFASGNPFRGIFSFCPVDATCQFPLKTDSDRGKPYIFGTEHFPLKREENPSDS